MKSSSTLRGLVLIVILASLAGPAWTQTVSTQTNVLPTGIPVSPMAVNQLTPWSLLTATAGLIAFHIGLFTLVGRERKSPFIINSVYPIFLLCLVVAAAALLAVLLPVSLQQWVLEASALSLVFLFALSALRVYRIAVRSVYFVDSIHLKHLPGIRDLRRWNALRSRRRNYAHDTLPIPTDLKTEITRILSEAGGSDFQNRLAHLIHRMPGIRWRA